MVFAFVGALLTSLAMACNAVVGISDYQRGECSGGGVCTDAGFVTDAPIDTAHDAKPDAPPLVETPGTPPVSWAQFRMPNYPQDGGPSDNVAVYSSGGQNAVRDEISGLTWREPAEKGEMTLADAQAACPDGWRLPSRIELVTLLDLSQSGQKIDMTKFPSTEAKAYWTSSVVRDVTGAPSSQQWTVDFENGGMGKKLTTGKAGVRCIKAAK